MAMQAVVTTVIVTVAHAILVKWLLLPRPPPECREPKSYPHRDPLLGLDLFLLTMKQIKEGTRRKAQQERVRTLGPTFKSNSLGRWMISTIDPLNSKTVFVTNSNHWGVEEDRLPAMGPFIGTGFLTTDGDKWKSFRGQLAHSFMTSNVTNIAMLKDCTDSFLSGLPAGRRVDIAPLVDQLALEVSGKFLFGIPMSQLSVSRPNGEVIDSKLFMSAFHASESGLLPRLAFKPIGRWLPNPRFWESVAIVHSFVDHMIDIADQRASTNEQKQASFGEGYGLVDDLLRQTTNKYEVRSQLPQSLMAMEQTVPAMANAVLWEIARNAPAWENLRREMMDLGQEKISAQALRKSPYLQKTLKEALRLHPPFAVLVRTATQDTTLPTGGGPDGSSPIFCRKGSSVAVLWSAIYRQEEVFGEDIDLFIPERWDDISPTTAEYAPFNTGPRRCCGETLGAFWASYIVARLALKYETLEAADKRPWKDEARIIGSNANGCLLVLKSGAGP